MRQYRPRKFNYDLVHKLYKEELLTAKELAVRYNVKETTIHVAVRRMDAEKGEEGFRYRQISLRIPQFLYDYIHEQGKRRDISPRELLSRILRIAYRDKLLDNFLDDAELVTQVASRRNQT